MHKIIILSNVEDSILSIVEYIADDNLFYANKVQEYIQKSIYLLGDFPYLGKPLEDNIHRQILEPKYKFKIVYRVDNKIIYIVSIFREQQNWK